MADSPTDRDDRLYRRIAKSAVFSAGPHDDQLGLLVTIGELGHPIGVRLLVDGILIAGAVSPVGRLADHLQDEARRSVGALDDPEPMAEALVSAFQSEAERVAQARAEHDELMEKYREDDGPLDIDEISIDDVDRFFRMVRGRDTFDLQDATVLMPGHDPMAVDTMRIRLSAVSAWWPLNAEGASTVYRRSEHDPARTPTAT